MSVKNAIGTSLLIAGLLLAIAGWSKRGGDTVEKEIQDKEVVLKNIDHYNLNWRAFFGLTFSGLAIGLLAFPSNTTIDAGKYD